jgi:hypothetical protein
LGVVALGLSLPVVAWDLDPYAGVDAKWSRMGAKRGLGDTQIAKDYPQGNLFVGLKLNEWVGAELGYESTTKKNRTVITKSGGAFFGASTDIGFPFSSTTKTRISGFHANVVGFYPVLEEYRVSLFGSIGLAKLKFSSDLVYEDVPSLGIRDHRQFIKSKLVPRVTAGVQHMLVENFGVRAMVSWEKTSTFRNIFSKTSSSPLYVAPKNTTSFGLGVFYSFK